MDSSSADPDRPHRLLALTGVVSLAASALLVALTFLNVPMPNDGAWYAYPGYAWSQGGDPSENIPGITRPSPPPARPFAAFGWENRSNLTVLFTAAWFRFLPASWRSLKALGIVQPFLLTAGVGLCVLRITRDRSLAFAAACVTSADARVIAEAAADARPDLPIAIAAVFLLGVLAPSLRMPLRTQPCCWPWLYSA